MESTIRARAPAAGGTPTAEEDRNAGSMPLKVLINRKSPCRNSYRSAIRYSRVVATEYSTGTVTVLNLVDLLVPAAGHIRSTKFKFKFSLKRIYKIQYTTKSVLSLQGFPSLA